MCRKTRITARCRGVRRAVHRTRTVAGALLLAATCGSAVAAASGTTPARAAEHRRMRTVAESPDEALHRIVFRTPLARFRLERSRAARAHRLDATTDGCSAPLLGSEGRSFNFRLPCERHDFAYRNFALRSGSGGPAWDAALRAAVDDQFQRDLQSVCLLRRGSFRLRCDAWVVVYFHTVRLTAGP